MLRAQGISTAWVSIWRRLSNLRYWRAGGPTSSNPRRPESPCLAIAGYYGFGNIGDEAILASMIADLRREFPGASFRVIGADYQRLVVGEDISYLLWTDWPGVIQAVRDCDALIVGGGGLFNSYLGYSPELLLVRSSHFGAFTFGLPLLASLLDKPCCIFAVGASHFDSPEALRHARLAVRLATSCTVRDDATRQILDDGVEPPARITVTADHAFRLQNADLTGSRLPADLDQSTMVVVLRNWGFSDEPGPWEPEIIRGLGEFAGRRGLRLLFIPFQSTTDIPHDLGRDSTVIERVRTALPDTVSRRLLEGAFTPGEISAVFARCGMVLGMRLHAAILAVRNGVPLVALGYESKVRHVLARCGLERFVLELDGLRADSLVQALETVFAERDRVREQFRCAAERMRRAAYENLRAVAEALAAANRGAETLRHSVAAAALKELALKQTLLLAERDAKLARLETETGAHRQVLRALVNDGNLEAALRNLDALLAAQPEDPEFQYLKAFCLQGLGRDLEAAKRLYGSALANGFDPFWVHAHRGELNLRLQCWREAADDLEKACGDDRHPPALVGLLEQALAHAARNSDEGTNLP